MEQKLEDLTKTLETEKASRTDLEMYVAVIETQKKVLQVRIKRNALCFACTMVQDSLMLGYFSYSLSCKSGSR